MAQSNVSLTHKGVSLVKTTYTNWRNDRTLRLGAGLAYYVVFSIIPMLAVSVYIASLLFPREEVLAYIQERMLDLFGQTASEVSAYFSQNSVLEAAERSLSGLGIFGFGALIVTASFAVIALNDSVNMIWGVPVKKGMRQTIRRYAFSYLIILSFALFLIAILTVQSILHNLEDLIKIDSSIADILTSTFIRALSWVLLVLALAWLIRILTRYKVNWIHSLTGSAITIGFMYIGVVAIGYYLSRYSFNSVTSAFSAVFFVLAWAYYESQILLAGFQLTKTLSQRKYLEN